MRLQEIQIYLYIIQLLNLDYYKRFEFTMYIIQLRPKANNDTRMPNIVNNKVGVE